MSQDIWDTIDPNTTSGTQLATLLNDFKDAVVTGFSGTVRPPNLQANGYWVDITDIGTNILKYMFYDGTNDIEIFKVNTANQSVIIAGSEDIFAIKKTSADSVGPILDLIKKRIADGGQTKINDILGDINFKGTDNVGVEFIQGRVRAISTDDVLSSEHGSYVMVETTSQDTNILSEAVRFTGDNKMGVGEIAPTHAVHAKATDGKAGVKVTRLQDSIEGAEFVINKKRSSGNGQTLNLDKIGKATWVSTDQNGDDVEVAKIEVDAVEDHTDTEHGSNLTIYTKKAGTTIFQEAIKIKDGEVVILGQSLNANINSTSDLEDDAVTRNLMTIDGAVYGAFTAEVTVYGRDNNPETRQQKIIINGSYDHNAGSWTWEFEDKLLQGQSNLVNLNFIDATILTIDYINQFVAAEFVDGKIYTNIRRIER